jgi:hypothetical protein
VPFPLPVNAIQRYYRRSDKTVVFPQNPLAVFLIRVHPELCQEGSFFTSNKVLEQTFPGEIVHDN